MPFSHAKLISYQYSNSRRMGVKEMEVPVGLGIRCGRRDWSRFSPNGRNRPADRIQCSRAVSAPKDNGHRPIRFCTKSAISNRFFPIENTQFQSIQSNSVKLLERRSRWASIRAARRAPWRRRAAGCR